MRIQILFFFFFFLASEASGQQVEIDENSLEFQEILSLYNEASEFKAKLNFDKAINTYQRALERFKNLYGTNHQYYGTFLSMIAGIYQDMGDYKKALPLQLKALESTKKTAGEAHAEYGINMNNLADLYNSMGEYQKALPLYLEVLKNFDKNFGQNHPNYGAILNNLGQLYTQMGQYDEALPISLDALRHAEKFLGKNHTDYGNRLNNLATLYYDMGEFQKALPLSLEALENTEQNLGKNHPDYGIRLNNLAQLYKVMGKFEKARPLYFEALENAENSLGKNHPDYGNRLNNLGDLFRQLGNYEKALPFFIEAVKNTKNSLGRSHPYYGIRIKTLAQTYTAIGEYKTALPLYLEALKVVQNSVGRDHPFYGTVLNSLADFYRKIGHFKNALSLYRKSMTNTERILGKNHPDYGIVLSNLALLYREMGDYNKALSLFLRAKENVETTLSKNHPNYVTILSNLSQSYKSMGDFERALELSLKVKNETEMLLGRDHPLYGLRLNDLAILFLETGRNQKALQLSIEALENMEHNLGKNHPDYGQVLVNIAIVYERLGDYGKAFTTLKEYNKITQLQIARNFSYQTAKEKESFFENNIGKYNFKVFSNFNYISDSKYKQASTIAMNNILTRKGILLNSSKNILEELSSLGQVGIDKKVNEFRGNMSFMQSQEQLPMAKRSKDFEERRSQLEVLERELVNLHDEHFGEEMNYVRDFKDIKLEEEDLAIEFTYFDVYNKQWTDSTMYVAYLYKKGWEAPKAINLFEAGQLEKYLVNASSPNQLYNIRGAKAVSSGTMVSDSIYKLVWEPLEEHTQNISKIYYSPDGLLHKIAFDALPNKEGELLGSGHDLSRMGNTADVNMYPIQPNLNDVLLIGGVEYAYEGDTIDSEGDRGFSVLESEQLLGSWENKNRNTREGIWNYLPGTQKEVEDIKSLLPASKIWSGKTATETSFKALSGNSPSVLHIATHGYFFPDLENKKEDRLLRQGKPYVHAENPLLRSGLILANANYAWQNGNNPHEDEDGILTALEISNLDLRNTDIVILSACETGLGDIPSSEGVYGLQRAFKMAGVDTIIMTLWEVPDKETAEFMKLFYRNLKKRNNPKDAFKEAQTTMMQKYREEPEKWGAFVYLE
ncbi:CHAT domain-containing protein [Flagellimonas onchidii]|uniref:CHAT domain-containing protein n=1 Tax=Flagellimonas onchidii TaxID=2562684 RepID=UPI0010A6799B|nr:CHAT domain-containing protein [Allomuricauda onchidii]